MPGHSATNSGTPEAGATNMRSEAMAQTSDQLSSIAARYIGMSNTALKAKLEGDGLKEVAHDIRSMAASLLRQDEVKGLRKLIRKVVGV
jgi:hypothetical protein